MSRSFTEKDHQHAAHCESGVASTLLRFAGLEISEPMAFGLSASMAFAYLPFVKVSGMPLIGYRMPPRHILKGLAKAIGIKYTIERFSSASKGMAKLDKLLEQGQLVGLQTSVYWLPYIPEDMRFHFNAHNLIAYAKTEQGYLISDPVFEQPVICDPASLQRARFAKGALAAKGALYQFQQVPTEFDLETAVFKSLKKTVKTMQGIPGVPFIGIKGINFLAKKIAKLKPEQTKYNQLYLSHIVRMQEEIGTGGAGFRFMYASFLDEAAQKLNHSGLAKAAEQMTDCGDLWRDFATNVVRFCKGRGNMTLEQISHSLQQCAEAESKVMQLLNSQQPNNKS